MIQWYLPEFVLKLNAVSKTRMSVYEIRKIRPKDTYGDKLEY